MKIPCVLVSAVLAALLLPAQAPVPRGTTTNPGTSTTGNSGSGGVVLPNIPTNLPPTPTSMNPDVNGRGAFFYGKVAMSDGTALPYQVVIERVCGVRPEQREAFGRFAIASRWGGDSDRDRLAGAGECRL